VRYANAPWLQRWINPDPAGTLDGLNLYRALKNSPLNHRDFCGRNGVDILTGQGVIARGLDNFPAPNKVAVTSALFSGKRWLSTSLSYLEEETPVPYARMVLDSTFGKDWANADTADDIEASAAFKEQLVARLSRLERFMRRLATSQRGRLLLVEGHGPDGQSFDALIVNTPAHGRLILIDKTLVDATHHVGLTKTMVHESSHAFPIAGEGFDTYDFWYASPFLPKNASEDDVLAYGETTMARSHRIANSAPDEAAMHRFAKAGYLSLHSEMHIESGLPEPVDSAERAEMFRSEAVVRQTFALRNADTIGAFALQFHEVGRFVASSPRRTRTGH